MAIQPVTPFTAPVQAVSRATTVQKAVINKGPDELKQSAEPQAAEPTSREQLDLAVGEVKRALAPVARNLQFSIDDATGRSVVKVVDATTNEVIRQMPSEELLAITRSMDKLSGLFVKQKV